MLARVEAKKETNRKGRERNNCLIQHSSIMPEDSTEGTMIFPCYWYMDGGGASFCLCEFMTSWKVELILASSSAAFVFRGDISTLK